MCISGWCGARKCCRSRASAGRLQDVYKRQGIKTALHEQNAFPGVTNKLLAPDVDIVFAAVPAAVEKLGAVSYTHLDVYKRQTYHCAGHKAHGTINLADALRQTWCVCRKPADQRREVA